MSAPFVTQKIASEIFALREFLLVEHGNIGWVHTLKTWHDQVLDELRVRAAPREPPDVRRVVLWAQDLETVLERIFAVSDDDRSHAENEVLYDALGMMRRELKAAIEALPVEMRESITAMVRRGVGGGRAAGEGEAK